ncbi:MAG: dipeptidase [Proteobacteria bacterium]|nr:dipeptidase [Pseudomonadota bacterium]
MDVSEARALHDDVPVIDLHADTPKLMHRMDYDIAEHHERPMPRRINYLGHVDLPRMREGGVAAQIFGMWTWPYPRRGCAASVHGQLDALDEAVRRHPDQITWAITDRDIRAAQRRGAIACLAGIEGGQALEGDLDNIARFAARGVRYIGLLHFSANQLGYPAYGLGADSTRGLTDLGKECIREMNRLGVVVDLAHISRQGFYDALEISRAPVMVSHTGVLGVHQHWRNIDDQQLRAVAEKGGCVGVIFARRFLGGKSIEAVVDHIMHIIDVAGVDVPALGSDFDGFVVPSYGLEDVSMMPHLTARLAARGLGPDVLKKILGENALRVLRDVSPTRAADVS